MVGRAEESLSVASIAPGFEKAEIERLRMRLAEAEDLLAAIRGGGVDALVVPSDEGDRVFTLTGSDHAYRILIEAMSESAITMSAEGAILYCNQRASELLKVPSDRLVGTSFGSHVCTADASRFDALLKRAAHAPSKGEMVLQAADGQAQVESAAQKPIVGRVMGKLHSLNDELPKTSDPRHAGDQLMVEFEEVAVEAPQERTEPASRGVERAAQQLRGKRRQRHAIVEAELFIERRAHCSAQKCEERTGRQPLGTNDAGLGRSTQ